MSLWKRVDDVPLLAFDVTTTLADHLAYNAYIRSLPAWRRRRAQRVIVALVAAPLLALVICLVAAWAVSDTGCDVDDALPSNGRLWIFLQLLGAVLAAGAAGTAIFYLRRARTLEASVRATLLRRPHVAPDDPELREPNHLAMHAAGFVCANESAAHAHAWTVVQRFDETADHMFLMVGATTGFIIPKRDLDPATILALRDVTHQLRPTGL